MSEKRVPPWRLEWPEDFPPEPGEGRGAMRCDVCGPNFIGRCPHGRAAPAAPPARLTEDELKLVAAQLTPEAANDFARMLREHGQPEGPAWDASEQAVRVRRRPYPEAYGIDEAAAPGAAERLLLEVAQAGALLPTKASRWALEVLHVLNAERSAWRAREVELQDEINALRGNERAVIAAMPPSPVAFAGDVPTYVISVLEWQRLQQTATYKEAIDAAIAELVSEGILYPAPDDGEMW